MELISNFLQGFPAFNSTFVVAFFLPILIAWSLIISVPFLALIDVAQIKLSNLKAKVVCLLIAIGLVVALAGLIFLTWNLIGVHSSFGLEEFNFMVCLGVGFVLALANWVLLFDSKPVKMSADSENKY
jgi:hypothetical protein